MAKKIMRSVTVTFYEDGEQKVELGGNWLRRDLESLPYLVRKEIARTKAKLQVKEKGDAGRTE